MNVRDIAEVEDMLNQLQQKEGQAARDRLVRNVVNEQNGPEAAVVDRSVLHAVLTCNRLGASAGRELMYYILIWAVKHNRFDEVVDWEAD